MSNNSNDDNLEQVIFQIVKEKKPQSVEQLAIYVRKKIPITNQKIIATIIRLQVQGKICLKEPSSQPSPETATH
jgi:hypothetical protein